MKSIVNMILVVALFAVSSSAAVAAVNCLNQNGTCPTSAQDCTITNKGNPKAGGSSSSPTGKVSGGGCGYRWAGITTAPCGGTLLINGECSADPDGSPPSGD